MTSPPSIYEGWVHDDVPGTYRFLRRLGDNDVELDENGQLRIKTSGFQPHRDSQAISITIVEIADSLGLDAMELVLNSPTPIGPYSDYLPQRDDYGICTGAVADIQDVELNVMLKAETWNKAHAVLFGRTKSNTRTLGGRLCRKCHLLRLPAAHRT